MANNNLVTQITIRAGVEGINDINRLADAIEEAGGDVGQLRQSARDLQNTWRNLSTDEQTRQLQNLSDEAQRLRNITNARMTLGLTGDDQVRQQIADVTQAYRTLQASGTLSQQELTRATQLHNQQLAQLEVQLEQARPTMSDIAGEMGNIVASAGGLSYVVREAMKFEAAMADVKKVVDGTPEQIQTLSDEIQNMAVELGMGADAVAQIAAQGGQLGVAIENLGEFTRMAGQMSVAFGISAEEAGEAAAKMANVWNIPIEKVGELGDAINTLGNTTAAKEKEIIDVMTRIGGTAKQFGLAKEEAAALSAAFVSLGKTPETAGTAINALLTKLSTASVQTDEFQDTLKSIGISADQMAKDINANPQKALNNFLKTLSTLNKEQQSITTFKLFGQEYVDDISLLVGGLDTYQKALGEVADKSQTAGAMQKEFEARMDTTSASLEQAKAGVGVLAQTIGVHLLPTVTSAIDAFTGITTAITDFASSYPNLTQFITIIVSAQIGLTALNSTMRLAGTMGLTSFGQITTGATTATGAITGATTATTTLSAALTGIAKSAIALTGAFMVGNTIGDWAYNSSSAVRAVGDEMGRLIAYTDAIFTDRTFADVNAYFETSAMSAQQLADNAQKAVQELQNIGNSSADFATKISQTETAITTISARIDELARYGQTSTTEYQKLSGELANAKIALDELKQAQENHQITTQNATNAHIELANEIKIATASLESMELALTRMESSGQTGSDAHKKLASEIDNTKSKLELLMIEVNKQGIGELLKTDLDKASESFKALGLDIQEFSTGISSDATNALNAFIEVARLAGDDIGKLARAYNAVRDKIGDNAQAQELLNFKLAQATNGNKELAIAIQETAQAQQQAKNATTEQQKALDALGVSMSAINSQMSTSGQKMADNLKIGLVAIKEQAKGADELKAALNQALDTSIKAAQTKADFEAIKKAIIDAGLSAQVSSEQMNKINTGATGGAKAVAELSEKTTKYSSTISDNSKKTDENTTATQRNIIAKKELKDANQQAAQSTNTLSEGSLRMAQGLAGLVSKVKQGTQELTKFGVSSEDAAKAASNIHNRIIGSHVNGFDDFLRRLKLSQNEIRQQVENFKEARSAALAMTEALSKPTAGVRELAAAQKVLERATNATVGEIKLMDKATLKGLQSQIKQVEERMRSLSDSAKQTVQDLQSELAELQGNETEVLRIKHAQKLAQLEQKTLEARAQGNQEAIAYYQKALELQQQINAEENRQASTKASQSATQANTKDITFEAHQNPSSELSAKDIGDMWAKHLDGIKQEAKREARAEFIQEMQDDIKRRAR